MNLKFLIFLCLFFNCFYLIQSNPLKSNHENKIESLEGRFIFEWKIINNLKIQASIIATSKSSVCIKSNFKIYKL